MPLSDIAIKNAQPTEKMYRLSDGDKLHLEVYPNGKKLWRVRLRVNGKETMLSLGAYPTVSLKEARVKRDEINIQLAGGIDPVAARRKIEQSEIADTLTFGFVYREWLAKQKTVWSKSHYDKLVIRMRVHVLSRIENSKFTEITPLDILAILRTIEAKGHIETAHRIHGICSQVFRYGVACGYTMSDPTRDLRGALAPIPSRHYAALTQPLAVGKLLLDIDGYIGSPIVQCAFRLSPLLFVRPGELRAAEWKEFDLNAAEWRIPAGRMKMKDPHIVPLAKQALQILHELHPMTGHGNFIFPSARGDKRCMSDNTITMALRRIGYDKGTMTAHGFRSMASTLLNELGYNRDWIERQLAHAERNQVRAAYNRASYLKERREMMQKWADYLDELRIAAIEHEKRQHR